MCLTVIVVWREMSPATAGPARSAEMTMLASILRLLLMLTSRDRSASEIWWFLVARGNRMWYTGKEGATWEIAYTRSFIISRGQWISDRSLVYGIMKSRLVVYDNKAIPGIAIFVRRTMAVESPQGFHPEPLNRRETSMATPTANTVASMAGVVALRSLSTTKATQSMVLATKSP